MALKYSLGASMILGYGTAFSFGGLSCKPSNFRKRVRNVINKAK
jgi:hypothetical protein